MRRPVDGRTRVAGVAGAPVAHSLSPLIHNAWLEASGLDGVYVPFPVPEGRFEAFIEGLRGGVIAGLNITTPFKARALAMADTASSAAGKAGAANLLIFDPDGAVRADNTDGIGLIAALAEAGWRPDAGPAAVIGAGGAARAAVCALVDASVREVRILNRTPSRAEAIAADHAGARAFAWKDAEEALSGAAVVINATTLGLPGEPPLIAPVERAAPGAVAMDMVYRPLETHFLACARAAGLRTADGLSMLIAQARPSFERLFGAPPPASVDVRGLCKAALADDTAAEARR